MKNRGLILMFIDRADSAQLNQIRQAVNDSLSERLHQRTAIDKIIELCQKISHQVADRGQWQVIETTPTMSLPERPFTFTMELQPNILT